MKEQKFAIFAKNLMAVKTFYFYMNNLKIIILECLIKNEFCNYAVISFSFYFKQLKYLRKKF